MKVIRKGKCIKKDTGKEFEFIEYKNGYRLFIGSLLDGITGKKYFKDNYEVKQ